MSKKVSIIYFSSTGGTEKLAKEVQIGADSVSGIEAMLIPIEGKDIIGGRYKNESILKQLDESDAIVFGSPTYFGNVASQFKAFADASVGNWMQQKWKDKIASGFTVSGVPSGDKLGTLQALHTFAMQHGMIWVGMGELPAQSNGVNRLGGWIGAMAQANQNHELDKDDLQNGAVLGNRVAQLTLKFNK